MSRGLGNGPGWLGNLALAVLGVAVIAFTAFVLVRDPAVPGDSSTRASAPATHPSDSSSPDGPTDGPSDGPASGSDPIETVIVIGDDGARLHATLGRWPDRLAEDHGWTVQNLSRRGTGYAVSAGPEACGLPMCPSFLDMIAMAQKQDEPDLIIVSGGVWDGELSRADMRSGVTTFFEALRAAYPDAEVVALNPLEITQPLPAPVGPTKRAVAVAVRDVGGSFVDVKQPYAGNPPAPEDGPLVDAANTAILAALDARLVEAG